MKNSKAQMKEHKRSIVEEWLDEPDSMLLNKELNSMTLNQLNALLKVVTAAYGRGYRTGSNDARFLMSNTKRES